MSHVTVQSEQRQALVEWIGAEESEPVNAGTSRSFSLYLPAGFIGTSVSFQRRVVFTPNGGNPIDTWVDFIVDGSIKSINVIAGSNYLPPELFSGCKQIKIKSDATETAIGVLESST